MYEGDFLPWDTPHWSAEQVAERFRWARAQGHPRYLWPDVPLTAWRQGLEVIAHVTGRMLAGPAQDRPVRLDLPTDGVTGGLGVAAFTSGMGPLLGYWIEQELIDAPPAVRELFLLHLRHGRVRARRGRELLLDVAERFARHEVPLTLLKGSHTAERYFPEPGTRPLQDIDIVVPERSFSLAERLLAEGGYRKLGTQPGPVRSNWAPRGGVRLPVSLCLTHMDSPLDIDLHASYRRKIFGVRTVDLSPGGADLVRRDDLPGEVFAVDGPLLALTVATHASEDLEGLQILRLVELCLLQRGWTGVPIFGAAALARAQSLAALRFAYPALFLTELLAPGTVDGAYLDEARKDAPPRMRRIIDGLSPASAQRVGHHTMAERFMAVRGPIETGRRLAHMLIPTSTGVSPRRLARLYKERWFQLRRGRVTVREERGEP